MAISQNPILPKCHLPKKRSPPTFFLMNLSETFRINLKMDFAHTNDGRFLIEASKKILSPKSKKSQAIFGFWAQNFFGGLNQKSALIKSGSVPMIQHW